MHARYLVDLAAIAAHQHDALSQRAGSAEDWSGQQFWVVSRARINHWTEQLKAVRHGQKNFDQLNPTAFWLQLEPVLEEIFLAEVCTRLWCATLATVDQKSHPGELDPIARSVFVASLEVRRQALRLLLFARGLPTIGTTAMNRLRFDCEIWTDQLLARIEPTATAIQFCFDKRRVKEDARDRRRIGGSRRGFELWSGQLLALRFTLAGRPCLPPTCAELNAAVCAVLMGCLPTTCFDGSGGLRPLWGVDAFQGDMLSLNLLSELLSSEEIAPPHFLPGNTRGR